MRLRLYHYWRSSSSWRVRWAFQLKGIPYESAAIDLLSDAAESPEHSLRNPLGFVPVVEFLDFPSMTPDSDPRRFIAESVAILEWAEETHSEPALLPTRDRPFDRAHVRQLVQVINSGIQPLQNLNTMHAHSADVEEQRRWNKHWIQKGLAAYERLAMPSAGRYSFGDHLSMADLFLIPQCYNATRNDVSLDPFPTVARIVENAMATEACLKSHPDSFKP